MVLIKVWAGRLLLLIMLDLPVAIVLGGKWIKIISRLISHNPSLILSMRVIQGILWVSIEIHSFTCRCIGIEKVVVVGIILTVCFASDLRRPRDAISLSIDIVFGPSEG